MKLEVRFELIRETKRTVRYDEVYMGEPVVGALYVHKTSLPEPYPEALIVTIEELKDTDVRASK